jgi:gamma-glutamyltranspeptidase/glutathione hydrolase
MVLGTPGGSRIISNVLQVFLNVADFGMNIQDAVNRPRFHHQWRPDILYMEPGFSPDTEALLKARGHVIERVEKMCEMSCIMVDDGWLQGAADPRVEGNALGY